MSYKLPLVLLIVEVGVNFVMSGLHSCLGYSSRLLVRCEWDEVRTNVDIHTLVWKLQEKSCASNKIFYAWFTFSSQVLVETFDEMWTRWNTQECRHSHSHVGIVDNEARHSKHSCFLWLGTDLPTCLQELRDEMRTGRECGRRDECTFHTFILVLSHVVSTRM